MVQIWKHNYRWASRLDVFFFFFKIIEKTVCKQIISEEIERKKRVQYEWYKACNYSFIQWYVRYFQADKIVKKKISTEKR